MAIEKVECFKCKFFYITWDEFFPRGCKALGFKSREVPSAVVFNSSGLPCQKFELNTRKTKGAG
ncbi:MAG: uracil-DNA glycosylase [Deltaproteobacteria bacterium GWB2_55_19]|nr:MAG: uracil-DNA glycosylase [Deltaproteobacteria bacterium GWB2_55_19]HAO94108.1 uracil-DNA glycosylase [Deltaproteobacteria bacterium]